MDRNLYYGDDLTFSDVALRKESVDRNLILPLSGSLCCVALRKESVDRNRSGGCQQQVALGRSPQGERG